MSRALHILFIRETEAYKVEMSRTQSWPVSYKVNNHTHIYLIRNSCIYAHAF